MSMLREITLRSGTVALDTRNVREVLSKLAADSGMHFHVTDEGTIAVTRDLSPLDRRALAIDLRFGPRTLVLRGDDVVVRWLANRFSRYFDAALRGCPDETAVAVCTRIDVYEDPLLVETRDAADDDATVNAVLELVHIGRIELAEGSREALVALVQAHSDAAQLYEALLDSDFVEDVFLSQSELVAAVKITRTARRSR